ncbi:hypothetical protein BB559_004850 [Furculomyces boomerangus]|uniref:Eukaryotic translation initiation factor 3 subunit G n=2 Tax=Harpellales TaxID=61421 RepID=A0A2T9YC91_9FUNG|nr:hypothetical protein BB559_004850 [Furculomyces boomerangus]PWA00869.1 hypothetical protein BB558_003063 [Smittium angustum]
MMAKTNNTSWADDTTDVVLNTPQVVSEENGVKTVVEYRLNDEGKQIKVTKKIAIKVIHETVNKAVADRKKWTKFGQERGNPPGPNISTTNVGEQVFLKISQWGVEKPEEEEQANKALDPSKNKLITCRLCKGNHFTSKCPYKDTLEPIEEITSGQAKTGGPSTAAIAAASDGSKRSSSYVPPHLRAGAKPSTGDSPRDRRDEHPTIRITNLSEDTKEQDVQALCKPFGSIARVFLAKDWETGVCKGYSFVSYYEKSSAESALKKLNGYGFDNLILRAEWSNPSN